MSPPRTVLAVTLLVGVTVVAGMALGVPSIQGLSGSMSDLEQTPEPIMADETNSPDAADRQTPSPTATVTATETPTADSDSTPTESSQSTTSASQEATTATTVTETDPPDDPETAQPTATPTDTPVATDGGDTDAPQDTDTSQDTDTPQNSDTPMETDTPRETETATPTDAPDGGDDGTRQCTADRDGHDKPALPDSVSPPSDATSVESGTPVSDSVGPDGEQWYTIDVQNGESLSVVTSGAPDGLSVAIFGPDGSPVDAHDVRTADRSAFGATVGQTGTYYVRVTAGDGYGGFYRLTAETAGPDRFDPNDDERRALPVASGSTTDATLAEGEVDWFAIKLEAGESISANVTVNGHALGRDLRIDIYSADGTRVSQGGAESETRFHPTIGTNEAGATATVSESGTYYVRVHCAALDGHAPYTLSIDTSPDN